MKNETPTKVLSHFGFLVGGIFILLAGISFWRTGQTGLTEKMTLSFGAVLIVLGGIAPRALRPIYQVWMRLGHLLGWINTRVILAVLFFFVVTPIGLALRLLGKKPFATGFQLKRESYWSARPDEQKSHSMKNQY